MGGVANSAYFALEDMDIGIIDIAKRIKNKEYAKVSKKNKSIEFNSAINYDNYDIIISYTPLGGIKQLEENGAKILSGKNMLIFQAHFAIDIWESSLKEQGDK